ncbi:hypothetical protein ACMT1E_00315 [Sphingomonas flavalba]|uniref:hypothetical protein n=1 Tax=Sphingomonas flavalba TaxID=2559804 RepID=UPI0039E04070
MVRLGISVVALAFAAPLAAQVESVPLPPSSVADDRPDAALSRDIGRAAGAMAVAAGRVAADAKGAARAAKHEFRRGFAEGASAQPPSERLAPPPIRYEEEAVDACAAAAEEEGLAIARLAAVRDILRVGAGRYGWDIEGTIDLRDSYLERRGPPLRFVCAVRDGGIADLRLGDSLARR